MRTSLHSHRTVVSPGTLAYPARIKPEKDNSFTITFRDVPEAISGTLPGEESKAAERASDALATAIAGYVNDRTLPAAPSRPRRGECLVPLDSVLAAKLLLVAAMELSGVTQAQLAKRMKLAPQEVSRLLDGDHASKIQRLAAALAAVGVTTALTALNVPAPVKGASDAAQAFANALQAAD
ncbi:type II toxin-antitoxin system HicB family antitoxin [Pyruvatibacter sp.]